MAYLRGLAPVVQHSSVKFIGVGIVNTLLTLSIIFALKSLLGAADTVANLVGYAAGLIASFALNRKWTFRHEAGWMSSVLPFLLVFGASYLLNLVIVLMSIRLGVNSYLAHIVGMPFYSIAFYFGCRDFVFKSSVPAIAAAARAKWTSERLAWLYFAVMAPYAIVMLYRLGAMPLQVWDEARLANNAIEMAYGGLSLVTTYDGLPDHWNTKPPLLIWIMAMAIRGLGASEWAIRLPSALASAATATIVFWFSAVHLKKPLVGVVSVLVMLVTPIYVLSHGARSGDYDAMLVLWTTSYLLTGYLYLHAPPMQRSKWLYLCTAGILLAFMTKTIQGLIMVPPLLIYAWLSGRLAGVVRSRQVYICVLGVFVVCLSYYVLREAADPGYFAAALDNDVVGRYASVIEGHQGGPFWYLLQYRDFAALVPGLVVAGYFAWRGPATTRSISAFLGLTAVFYLAVISSASTKLAWYSMPLCPLMAILIGIGVDRLNDLALARLPILDQRMRSVSIICCVIAAVVAVGTDIRKVNYLVQAKSQDELDRISLFLRSLASTRNEHLDVAVIHPGYPNDKGDPFYVAPALFYARMLQAQSHNVDLLPPAALGGIKESELVVCGQHMLDQAIAIMMLRPAKLEGSCGLYTVAGLRRR